MTRGGVRRRTRSPYAALVVAGILLGVLAAAVVVAARAPERVRVTSDSMEPTLAEGSTVRVDTSVAGGRGLRAGDVVVFRDPGGWLAGGGAAEEEPGQLVKRVIALGGQTVSCCDGGGRLLVDGVPLVEPYLPAGVAPSTLAFDVRVPAGRLWLMGDNRATSHDSRAEQLAHGRGAVPVEAVVGRVVGQPGTAP